MKGKILDFSVQTNTGVISGDDQKRYNFIGSEWCGSQTPNRGDNVDFDVDPEGKAIKVYIALDSSRPIQHTSSENKDEMQFNMVDWFIKCLKNYTNFSGRARRKEYWFFVLSQFCLLFIAIIIDNILFDDISLFYILVSLGLFLPSLAVAVRRLHDTDRSGWFILISLIPIIGLILIYWLASDTKLAPNQWGDPAK